MDFFYLVLEAVGVEKFGMGGPGDAVFRDESAVRVKVP